MPAYTAYPQSWAELKAAIAVQGNIIWLDPGTVYDAGIEIENVIATGVEMYSNRGTVGPGGIISGGAIVRCKHWQTGDPFLFRTGGEGIRLQGITFEGPSGVVLAHDTPLLSCVLVDHAGFRAENCVFHYWPKYTVQFKTPGMMASCLVEHNTMEGFGYGFWGGGKDHPAMTTAVQAVYAINNRHTMAGSGHEKNMIFRSSQIGRNHTYQNAENHTSSGTQEGGLSTIVDRVVFHDSNRSTNLPLPKAGGRVQVSNCYTDRKWAEDGSGAAYRVGQTKGAEAYLDGESGVYSENLHYSGEGMMLPICGELSHDITEAIVQGSYDPDGLAIDYHRWRVRTDQAEAQFIESVGGMPLVLGPGYHRVECQAVNSFGIHSRPETLVVDNRPGDSYWLQVMYNHTRPFTATENYRALVVVENLTLGTGAIVAHSEPCTEANTGYRRVLINLAEHFPCSAGDEVALRIQMLCTQDAIHPESGCYLYVDGVQGWGFDVGNGHFDNGTSLSPWSITGGNILLELIDDSEVGLLSNQYSVGWMSHYPAWGAGCCRIRAAYGSDYTLGTFAGIEQTAILK